MFIFVGLNNPGNKKVYIKRIFVLKSRDLNIMVKVCIRIRAETVFEILVVVFKIVCHCIICE